MSANRERAASASSADVEAAALEVLRTASAVDAVVTGVLVAAATSPGVLLGPVHVLVGGVGAGARAYDGRPRQPGLGVPRPRGFQPSEVLPPGAFVAVPTLVGTLAAVAAESGNAPLARAADVAAAHAKGTARHDVLRAVARLGARAFEAGAPGEELLRVGGRLAGGVLTQEDLAAASSTGSAVAERAPLGAAVAVLGGAADADLASAALASAAAGPGAHVLRVPLEGGVPASAHGVGRVVAATDWNGLSCVAYYEESAEGAEIAALGLLAPRAAVPVRRGEARVKVGERLGRRSPPIAVLERGGVAAATIGVEAAEDVRDALLGRVLGALGADTSPSPEPPARVVGVLRSAHGATPLRL